MSWRAIQTAGSIERQSVSIIGAGRCGVGSFRFGIVAAADCSACTSANLAAALLVGLITVRCRHGLQLLPPDRGGAGLGEAFVRPVPPTDCGSRQLHFVFGRRFDRRLHPGAERVQFSGV
jgi:hypothetical protein